MAGNAVAGEVRTGDAGVTDHSLTLAATGREGVTDHSLTLAATGGEGVGMAGGAEGAAGTAARPPGVEFAVATRADEAELRALLRATPTPGAVSLRFEREPDYFAGENVAGGRDTTIVARRGGRVVCMGRCTRRTLYVGGVKRDVGYLGELRLAPGTPRGLAVLRAGYAFFARLEAEAGAAEIYFTSVAGANERARAVLESGRLGLPTYEGLAELTTVAWPVRRRGRERTKREAMARAEGGEVRADWKEIIQFLDTQAGRHGFAMPWTEGAWRELERHGLAEEDLCVVRRDGRIVAAGAVWDQSAWRQTVVAGYAGATRWMRPVINGLATLAGRPGLPDEGARLKQACVHPLAVAHDAAETDVDALLEALERRAKARGVEWLVASVASEDALRARLGRRSGAREYGTRLYAVTLPGLEKAGAVLAGQGVRPEAGLL